MVDRMAVLVSSPNSVKLLGVPVLEKCTGKAHADGVFNALQDWQLTYKVIGMSFDTTRSNTGTMNGTCTLLEQKLGRRLLHLACRHYVHELIIGKVFEVSIPEASSGPNIKLFQKFPQQWTSLNPQQIKPLSFDDSIRNKGNIGLMPFLFYFISMFF